MPAAYYNMCYCNFLDYERITARTLRKATVVNLMWLYKEFVIVIFIPKPPMLLVA